MKNGPPATFLWRIEIRVPKAALRDFEAALESRCASVSSFMLDDDGGGDWRIEGFAGAEPDKEGLGKAFAKLAAAHEVGGRVFHQKFGYGRVTAIDGGKLDIAFDKAGRKKVMASFVEVA